MKNFLRLLSLLLPLVCAGVNLNAQNSVTSKSSLIPVTGDQVALNSTKNNFQNTRLSSYEKMLKNYKLEEVEIKNKGGDVDVISSKISTLKAMISFEMNKKSQQTKLSDLPKYVNTGNLEVDIKNYEDAKRAWIKNHPEEYQKITQARRMPEAIEIDNLLKYKED